MTTQEQADYEEKIIMNAERLQLLGYDIDKYLESKGLEVGVRNQFENEFPEDEEEN
jgi:hypothetical protein